VDAEKELKMHPEKCSICGGRLERQTITHQQHWGPDVAEFENVPALVCVQCGEVWLEAPVAQLLEQIVRQKPEPKRYHQVPVFAFNELTPAS
jgi:YgiT-type zinc finger domain-containing protein